MLTRSETDRTPGGCQTETYGAEQAFIERRGEVDNVLNMGASPYLLFVTIPDVPRRLRENRRAEPRHV